MKTPIILILMIMQASEPFSLAEDTPAPTPTNTAVGNLTGGWDSPNQCASNCALINAVVTEATQYKADNVNSPANPSSQYLTMLEARCGSRNKRQKGQIQFGDPDPNSTSTPSLSNMTYNSYADCEADFINFIVTVDGTINSNCAATQIIHNAIEAENKIVPYYESAAITCSIACAAALAGSMIGPLGTALAEIADIGCVVADSLTLVQQKGIEDKFINNSNKTVEGLEATLGATVTDSDKSGPQLNPFSSMTAKDQQDLTDGLGEAGAGVAALSAIGRGIVWAKIGLEGPKPPKVSAGEAKDGVESIADEVKETRKVRYARMLGTKGLACAGAILSDAMAYSLYNYSSSTLPSYQKQYCKHIADAITPDLNSIFVPTNIPPPPQLPATGDGLKTGGGSPIRSTGGPQTDPSGGPGGGPPTLSPLTSAATAAADPLTRSLAPNLNELGKIPIPAALAPALEKMKHGEPLSKALDSVPGFPDAVKEMFKGAEQDKDLKDLASQLVGSAVPTENKGVGGKHDSANPDFLTFGPKSKNGPNGPSEMTFTVNQHFDELDTGCPNNKDEKNEKCIFHTGINATIFQIISKLHRRHELNDQVPHMGWCGDWNRAINGLKPIPEVEKRDYKPPELFMPDFNGHYPPDYEANLKKTLELLSKEKSLPSAKPSPSPSPLMPIAPPKQEKSKEQKALDGINASLKEKEKQNSKRAIYNYSEQKKKNSVEIEKLRAMEEKLQKLKNDEAKQKGNKNY